jgi:isopenicillin-N N-acyltransferase like protein
MKLKAFFAAVASFSLLSVPAPAGAGTSTAFPEPVLPGKGEVKVLELHGSPYERGVLHGKTLKREIHELIRLWKADLESSYKMEADAFIAKFLKQTDFQKSIKKWTPDLWQEVRGIADGSGVAIDTIFVFQLPDELWANGGDVAGGEHCSSIGVNKTATSPTYVAQTMDIPAFYHGYQTLLHVKDTRSNPEAFVLTVPGLIGLNGLNRDGVAITCNTLLRLEYSKDGLPVAFIVRAVLQQKTLKNAVAFLHDIKHASGQNYIVGGAEGAHSFECSANKVSEFVPYANAPVTYHTNHPLANDDYNHTYLANLKKRNKTVADVPPYVCYRLEALERRLKNKTNLDIEVLKAALSSRDHERNPVSNGSTFAGTVMVLSADPELHVAAGKPHETAFQIFRFPDRGGSRVRNR